jgi:hypothetical protein
LECEKAIPDRWPTLPWGILCYVVDEEKETAVEKSAPKLCQKTKILPLAHELAARRHFVDATFSQRIWGLNLLRRFSKNGRYSILQKQRIFIK